MWTKNFRSTSAFPASTQELPHEDQTLLEGHLSAAFPPLSRDLETDALIIGGGTTGVTAACLLAKAGKSVVLVEKIQLSAGETNPHHRPTPPKRTGTALSRLSIYCNWRSLRRSRRKGAAPHRAKIIIPTPW